MRTYVITGGTDGMGRALGLHFARRGDRVIAVASGAEKGRRFVAEAGENASFLRADLSTLEGMRRVVEEVPDVVDGLVFGAQRFRPSREETADGLEFTFALMYLSRFVIGHGLVERLERAEAPVIMNIAGPGGLPGTVHWDDLQLTRRYKGMRASMQASRCLDLLGADFAERHPGARTRYVLYNPGFVDTGMADPLPPARRVLTKVLAKAFAKSPEKAIVPIARLMDERPEAPVSAFKQGKPLALEGEDFDPVRAARLHDVTVELIGGPPVRT
ncbi:SDR family NAD(P)-dependent oxidoreductase [Spirillospora sp. NPDC047279]|uniref:SDR family NAD(P)-dependent oxidoreductase n=1 Tax=Spirillospora sp. NPDC047279 TaxID=3155478 RepID=UPI0033D71DBE